MCQLRAAGKLVFCNATYRLSTYSTIWYSCIKDVINFCEGVSTITKSAHIIFDKKNQRSSCGLSNCSCFLSSTGNFEVTYIDIRMARIHTDFTVCSSAVLVSDPTVFQNKQCNTSLEEHEHFEYQLKNKTSVSKLSIELRDLYANGADDSPEFVWILVKADKNADITVKCESLMPTTCTTSTDSTTTSTTSTDSTTTSTSSTGSTTTSTTSNDNTTTSTSSTDSTTTSTTSTDSTTTSTTSTDSTTTSTSSTGSTTTSTTSTERSTTATLTPKSDASSGVAVISGVAASVGLLVMITMLSVCFNIIKRGRNRQPETKPGIPIDRATEHHISGRLAEPNYDNAPDLRVIRLRDGYIDFAVRGHSGSQNTALAWSSDNVKPRPILPTRPQLSERNSRHNLPEPRSCRNVSNLHHLRATKKDVDGHQLLHSGSQSQDREQEFFDYMKPLPGIRPLSVNDLRRNYVRTGNGNSSDRSSTQSNEHHSMDGTSKLLARKMFKIDGQDVHSIVIDMRLVMNK
ncbi:serine-rich adhesin for platelets-like [Dreissena polymorpha]|nr:serine-rich adhesin for platelets-like [Dreissena polymorpha]